MPSFDPEVMGSAIDEVAARTDALLQGRRTWQVMAGAWPDRAGDEFADWMNRIPKYVVSDTLSPADEGGSVDVMGNASVARALLAADSSTSST